MFPPARKSKKLSKAWKFVGFNKDKAGQFIIDHTICGLCGKLQKYRNTRHILAEHSDKWKGEDESTLKNTRMDNFYLAQPLCTSILRIILSRKLYKEKKAETIEELKNVE